MPTYEYRCQDCGHTFENFQGIKDEPLENCPKCYGKVQRLIGSGTGIIFKGSGFYETDYRSDGYKQAAKKEAPKSDVAADKKETSASDTGKTSDKGKATSSTKTSDSSSKSKKEK